MRLKLPLPLAALLLPLIWHPAEATDACARLAERYADLQPTTPDSVSWGPCPDFRIRGVLRAEHLRELHAEANGLPKPSPGSHRDLIQALTLAADQFAGEDAVTGPTAFEPDPHDLLSKLVAAQLPEYQLEWALRYQMLLLRQALQQRNFADASSALTLLLTQLDTLEPDWRYGWLKNSKPDLEHIQRMVSGDQLPIGNLPVVAPAQPWVSDQIGVIQCAGDGSYRSYPLQDELPTVGDAWMALGDAEQALTWHLQEYWLSAAAALELPDGLRARAEAAYGPARAQRLFQAALASIEIRDEAFGRTARINLFGRDLPLPVASYESDDEEFADADDEPLEINPEHLSALSVTEIRTALQQQWDQQDLQVEIARFEDLVAGCNAPTKESPQEIRINPRQDSDQPSMIELVVIDASARRGCPRRK